MILVSWLLGKGVPLKASSSSGAAGGCCSHLGNEGSRTSQSVFHNGNNSECGLGPWKRLLPFPRWKSPDWKQQSNCFQVDEAAPRLLQCPAAAAKRSQVLSEHCKVTQPSRSLADTRLGLHGRCLVSVTPQVTDNGFRYPSLLFWSEILTEGQRSKLLEQKTHCI